MELWPQKYRTGHWLFCLERIPTFSQDTDLSPLQALALSAHGMWPLLPESGDQKLLVSNTYCSLVFGSSFDIPAFPDSCSKVTWADNKLKPEIGNHTHLADFKEQHLYYWADKTIHMPYLSKWIEWTPLNILQNGIRKRKSHTGMKTLNSTGGRENNRWENLSSFKQMTVLSWTFNGSRVLSEMRTKEMEWARVRKREALSDSNG